MKHRSRKPAIGTLLLFIALSPVAQAQPMPEVYYRLQAAIELGSKGSALLLADSCLTLKPQRYQYIMGKGQSLFMNGMYAEAIPFFINAENKQSGSGSLWLARCFCITGDTASCFGWLRKHLESPQRVKESEILLDITFNKLHPTTSWRKLWETDWYNALDKAIADAEYLIGAGKHNEALDLLNARIKGSKSRYVLHHLRGDAYLALNNPSAATNDYKIAYRKGKRNPIYLVKIAQALAQRNQIQAALKNIDEAIEQSGGNPKFHLAKAEVLCGNGRAAEAYSSLKYYLSFYPSSSVAIDLFAQSAIEANMHVEALLALAKLVKLHPHNPRYHYLRGTILVKTEQPKLAIPDFDFSIQQNYMVAASYFHKGMAHIALGEKDQACTCFSISALQGYFKAQEMQYRYCK